MIEHKVLQAEIDAFRPDKESGFGLAPPKPSETSVLYHWGVHVSYTNAKTNTFDIDWICLGSQACRDNWTLIPLYGGKTSNGTKHLKDAHQVTSDKTLQENDQKRSRDQEIEDLRTSQIIRQDPKRMRMLIETRDIVLMNRPFCSGESNDKEIINALMIAEEFCTSVNEKAVARSLIEMYVSTKREVMMVLKTRQPGVKSVTLVIDFWTCKVQHKKYLGVRVYFIDTKWKRQSVILGIRAFDPTYAARTNTEFRGCFLAWVKALLKDFGISESEVFGGMTAGASDVKRLVSEELNKAWEWCIPHMMNAATKWACGLTDNAKDSVNPELTALIERVRITIRQVRDVEQMGNLFEALCELEGESKSVKLIDYQSHRFLGLTNSIERVLEKWHRLVVYYQECAKQPAKKKALSAFLLKNDRAVLSQLLSLLKPITILKKLSQSEETNQFKSLMLLFKIRQVTLDVKTPLRDYRSTAAAPTHIAIADLEPVIVKTRALLAEALDLFLDPRVKDLDDNLVNIVKYCALQRSDDFVRCDRIGSMVKDQERASLKGYSIEMSSFIRANSQFIKIEQCDKIPTKELHKHIPKFMLDEPDPQILPRIFSQRCSVDEGEEKAPLDIRDPRIPRIG